MDCSSESHAVFHLGSQEPTSDDGDKWLKELELLYGRGIRELVTKELLTLAQKKGFAPTANRKSNRKSKKKGKSATGVPMEEPQSTQETKKCGY